MSSRDRPRALLLHSGGLSARQWRRLGEALAPTHEVLAPDLIGYGAAGVYPIGQPFHFRQDVARLVELVGDGEPVDIVGHSYGGLLALQLSLAQPARVRSLALYEPVAFGVLDGPGDAEAHAALEAFEPYRAGPEPDTAWLTAFVDWWNGPGAWTALAEPVRASFRAVGWKLSEEVTSLIADRTSSATYATITAPTLLLGGDRSPAAERRTLERLAASLPNATLTLFPGLGHMGPISHGALVDAAIVAFLRARP